MTDKDPSLVGVTICPICWDSMEDKPDADLYTLSRCKHKYCFKCLYSLTSDWARKCRCCVPMKNSPAASHWFPNQCNYGWDLVDLDAVKAHEALHTVRVPEHPPPPHKQAQAQEVAVNKASQQKPVKHAASNISGVKCDKCDGPHATDECPFYPNPRTNDEMQRRESTKEVKLQALKRPKIGLRQKLEEENEDVMTDIALPPITASATSSSSSASSSAASTAGVLSSAKSTTTKMADAGSAYLLGLSQAQRDAVLGAIVYTNRPQHYSLPDTDAVTLNRPIVNYSQLYARLSSGSSGSGGGSNNSNSNSNSNSRSSSTDINSPTSDINLLVDMKFPVPTDLRNGDRVQFGNYRGVGTYYVLWLHSGSTAKVESCNTSALDSCIDSLKSAVSGIVQRVEGQNKPVHVPQFTCHNADMHPIKESFPRMSDRSAPGPHSGVRVDGHRDDSNYECILFENADEMGYGPAPALSTVPLSYFAPEFEICVVDPLLIHSGSANAAYLTNSGGHATGSDSDSEEEADEGSETGSKSGGESDDPDFPLAYIGYIDAESMDIDEMPEWTPWSEVGQFNQDMQVPDGYFVDMRAVMAAHFQAELAAQAQA